MAEAEKEAKKKKTPTAQKRIIQDTKKRAISRSFKSKVRTAINAFEKALSAGEKEMMQSALNTVYSLMDKGVKKGIYKQNKAARVKSQVSSLQQKSA
ncbi:MAG: 30S ribosomal protein S20 [Simkania sp.]|uniref:Small ribosomal subunit protein bS20 n=1 Tax=Simkania negevensis (strain ATCC VR-1471 / DSM 27360 / Z) TaxID=331113 RepID=F8L4H7_SIMNZ|nr:30S ribosomal protein S20 [Simkania negevensis]MCB1067553.1 30S ribosomal protein S20 [Simkania sp.]MCP5491028.1 30S ribosomal protein S20 [Chlamydiales bacterium]MCB1074726.1 30S ribosomal protein S20 [Simkania sp.]MCB1082951.1 30S ribosomal protein S20 [Simkania sp.]CCB90228.1 30S ribosomal protein S20 [Simkania negevensis Z]